MLHSSSGLMLRRCVRKLPRRVVFTIGSHLRPVAQRAPGQRQPALIEYSDIKQRARAIACGIWSLVRWCSGRGRWANHEHCCLSHDQAQSLKNIMALSTCYSFCRPCSSWTDMTTRCGVHGCTVAQLISASQGVHSCIQHPAHTITIVLSQAAPRLRGDEGGVVGFLHGALILTHRNLCTARLQATCAV